MLRKKRNGFGLAAFSAAAMAVVFAIVIAGCEDVTGALGTKTLTGEVEITGTPQVGSELKAVVDTSATGSLAYIWQQQNADDEKWTTIQDANEAAYTLVASDVNRYLRAVVTADGYSGTIMSSAVGPIAAATPDTAATPTANPAASQVEAGDTVELTTETEGADIYYTLDGTDPDPDSDSGSIKYENPIPINEDITIKAIAVKEGMTNSGIMEAAYTVVEEGTVTQPLANPAASEVAVGATVTLTTATPDADIYYTLDGTTPTTNSTKYGNPIAINKAVTIKAIAVKTGMTDSNMMEAAYTAKVATPTADRAAGEVGPGTTVTLATTTSGADIYYTTNGTAPSTNSTKYAATTPIVINKNVTIKAIAVKTGCTASDILTAAYTVAVPVKAAQPSANPPAGAVTSGTKVTLTTTTSGADIHYTTNGTTPTTSSAKYGSPIAINKAITIKAIAVKAGMTNSDILTAAYTVKTTPSMAKAATPTANPPAGAVTSGTKVTLTTTTSGADIHYTTNGNTPTANSTKYTGQITISSAVTIKAIAVKTGFTDSDILTTAYTVVAPGTVAQPSANPPAGEVAANTRVTLATTTAGATIYYTDNGDTPDSTKTQYTGPIPITTPVTIKAIAVKEGLNDSNVLTAAYTVQVAMPTAMPTATPTASEVDVNTTVTLATATAGAQIYYTVDGTDPDSTKMRYTGSIPITGAVTIKAIAVKDNFDNSNVLTATYTVSTKHRISNEAELLAFASAVTAVQGTSGYLTTNITLSSAWTPIGKTSGNTPPVAFTGTFDGTGHTISGLSVTGTTSYLALFGRNNGTIKNLTLEGTVTANYESADVDYIAGVVAYNDISGTVQNVISKVTVTADYNTTHNIGGIAGFNGWDQYNNASPHYNQAYQTGGIIRQCRNEGAVTGGFNKIGGIVGENAWQVTECVNTGTITCRKASNGLVVTGWPGVGGIAGRNGNNNAATERGAILNCYNWGIIADETGESSPKRAYGGITGWCNNTSSVINCYTTTNFSQSPNPSSDKNPIIGMADSTPPERSVNNYSRTGIYAANSGNVAYTGAINDETYMKSQAFVTALNSGTTVGTYVYVAGSYPKLSWETQ
jgi:hypothetical protein